MDILLAKESQQLHVRVLMNVAAVNVALARPNSNLRGKVTRVKASSNGRAYLLLNANTGARILYEPDLNRFCAALDTLRKAAKI